MIISNAISAREEGRQKEHFSLTPSGSKMGLQLSFKADVHLNRSTDLSNERGRQCSEQPDLGS